MKSRFLFGSGLFVACATAALIFFFVGPVSGQALQLPSSSKATVVMLETSPMSAETHLVMQPVDQETPAPAVATLQHAVGGHAKGTLINAQTQRVAVVADMPGRGDPSWNAALFVMAPHQDAVLLARDVYTGTRPAVLSDGRIAVPRGAQGAPPSVNLETGMPETLRVDPLRVDVIDPISKESKTIFEDTGYFAYMIGALDQEVYIYRYKPGQADIIAIDAVMGQARIMAQAILPYARDFSIDPITRSILYTQRAADNPFNWTAVQLPLDGSEQRVLATSDNMALYPHAWLADKVVVFERGVGLVAQPSVTTGRTQKSVATAEPLMRVGSQESLEVRAFNRTRSVAIAQKTKEGALSTPVVIRTSDAHATKLSVRQGMRTDIVGVIE